MRLDKMTSRLQSALGDAQSLAMGRDHVSVEPIHLVSVFVEQGETVISESIDYNSHNTERLDVDGVKELLLRLNLIQDAMSQLQSPP